MAHTTFLLHTQPFLFMVANVCILIRGPSTAQAQQRVEIASSRQTLPYSWPVVPQTAHCATELASACIDKQERLALLVDAGQCQPPLRPKQMTAPAADKRQMAQNKLVNNLQDSPAGRTSLKSFLMAAGDFDPDGLMVLNHE
jgi:hypothetical protein